MSQSEFSEVYVPSAFARTSTPRSFLMCPPDFFEVVYSINPWMDPSVDVDVSLAKKEWLAIHDAFVSHGHEVSLIPSLRNCPDMVFAANGALTINNKSFISSFKYPQRQEEAAVHAEYLASFGKDLFYSSFTAEGEGDFLVGKNEIFAGFGFRTQKNSHVQLASFFEREVISLELVDPRFYHLDTAMLVLDEKNLALFKPAFSLASLEVLSDRFDLLEVKEEEALRFALNGVNDGHNIFLPTNAPFFTQELVGLGFTPHTLSCSELLKAGGAVKCVTAEFWRD